VREESPDVRRGVAGDAPGIESAEGLPEILALVEHGPPAQPRLERVEDEVLEVAPVVVRRSTPLFVVIPVHERVAAAGPAGPGHGQIEYQGVSPAYRMVSQRGAPMKRPILAAIVLALGGVSFTIPPSENWAEFHGNGGTGRSDGTDLPREWSESKNVVWKTALHGMGL